MITLSILIPTFNRANKLLRLLKTIEAEIANSDIKVQIRVLVSDNASTDDTFKIISQFSTTQFKFNYFCQAKNLGFDGNIRFLYDQAETDYIWYLADDDILLPGSISTILNVLKDNDPDVLLFSFVQPPGSRFRQFDYPEPVRIVSDPVSAIEHVLRYTKLSIFVIRKISFNNSQWKIIDENIGSGWYYISLAFSALETAKNILLAVISEPLASCDEDYTSISYTPYPLMHMDKMVGHSFVIKHQPNLPQFYACKGYCQAIQFAFAAKVGSLSPEYMEEYDDFIKGLECRITTLLRHPRSLIQFIALKLHIAILWPKIKRTIELAKSLFKL